MPLQRNAAAWSHNQLINNKLWKLKSQTSINNFVWHLFLIRCWLLFNIRFDISILSLGCSSDHRVFIYSRLVLVSRWPNMMDSVGWIRIWQRRSSCSAHPNMAKFCVTFAQISGPKHRENSVNICTLPQTCNCHMLLNVSISIATLTASLCGYASWISPLEPITFYVTFELCKNSLDSRPRCSENS